MSPYEGAANGKHYWLTPKDLYAKLDAEFHFDFDPCPHPVPDFFDGKAVPWGQSNYVNPPFKGPTAWVRKAITENRQGKGVVFVFPIDRWVLMMIEAGAEIRNLGDVKWLSTEDGLPGNGTGRHIAAFILRPGAAKDPPPTARQLAFSDPNARWLAVDSTEGRER
jgi:DNA N-6-adenine-methyltransferase (Dam)